MCLSYLFHWIANVEACMGTVFPQPHLGWLSVPTHSYIALRVSLKFIQCEGLGNATGDSLLNEPSHS